ncbi:hypothetical protein PVK06_035252 [Gossypium arboreum]|uniref:Uncharacterized protein n=1 Tax=Gossypium arboreum TaxID=29729 RepID=A0ABR0NIG9_GOSAR|nr:hypothetical protein PVK06_035252 [Gossypium arboreum]
MSGVPSLFSLRVKHEVSKDLIDKLQLHYLPNERRFHLIEKGKVENEIKPQAPKGMKSFFHGLYCVGKSVGEVRLTRRPKNLIMFDKEFSCETLNLFDRDGNENYFTLGDNLECFPSKKGEHENNMFPFRTICGYQVFGNESIRIMNKGVRDDEKYFASK